MSYSTLKSISKNNKHGTIEELRNSHGTAPVIWGKMCVKYLGAENEFSWSHGYLDELWPLYKNKSVKKEHRASLMFTYDKLYVLNKDFGRLSSDINTLLNDFIFNPDHVNHWPRIIEILNSGLKCDAVGLWCTSVSGDPYSLGFDDETDEEIPADFNDDLWNLYDELDKY